MPGPTGSTGATGPAGVAGTRERLVQLGQPDPLVRPGSGRTGPSGPSAVSANAGNIAALGTDSLILVPSAISGNASAGQVVKGNDGRLSDARTPTAHHTTHESGGSDALTLAESQITNLVTDLAGKATAGAAIPESQVTNLVTDLAGKVGTGDSRLSDARTPLAHAPSHVYNGTDPLLNGGPISVTTAPFTIPTVNGTGTLTFSASTIMGFLGVANAIWILPGPSGGTGSGFLQIAGTPTSTTVLVRNLPLYGQATPGQVVATGAPIYLAGDLNFAGNGFSGLCPALDGAATSVLKGDSTVGSLPYSSLSSLPTLGTSAPLNVPASGNASSAQVVLGTDTRLSDARALSGSIAESSVTNLVTDLAAKVGTADSRLSDARTPTAHHATHAAAGSDPLTLTKAQISDFPTLGTASAKDVPSSGNASSAQVVYGTDTRLSDARTPSAHETTHLSGGADAIPLSQFNCSGPVSDSR